MGTNYYRIPKVSEMTTKFQKFHERLKDINVWSASDVYNGFRIEEGDSWDYHNPWTEFMEGTSIHLGKRSMGWRFCWNFHDNKYYKNKEELIEFIKGGRVVDEYSQEIQVDEFLEMAFNWGDPDGCTYNEEYIQETYTKQGKPRPFTASREYYDREIDGLRVSSSTDFS